MTSTFTVEMLPARNGDALWISYGDDKHLLVDCGHLAKDAAAARITDAGRVELFIVTHMARLIRFLMLRVKEVCSPDSAQRTQR